MIQFPLLELPADSAGLPRDLRQPDARWPRSRDEARELFRVVAQRPSLHRGRWLAVTALLHIATLTALVLVPIFWMEPLLDSRIDPIRVLIYDPPPPRPPRLLRQVRPEYRSEAFVKKVEGTVVLEIVIDERGRVARTRIVQSVRLLDAAAVAAVRQWVFAPAEKRGRPVATLAIAPVSFRIF